MKRLSYEAKPLKGIPNLTEAEIQEILSQNPMRVLQDREPIENETLIGALETLKADYAAHTGRDKKQVPVKSSEHAPCLGLDGKCGSTDFMRTGTCYVCLNCQTSQGCS